MKSFPIVAECFIIILGLVKKYRVTHGSRTFLEQIVHGKWLWEGDELEVFPPLMECQSSHNGAVNVTTSFVRLR